MTPIQFSTQPLDLRLAQHKLPEVGTELNQQTCKDLALQVAWNGAGHVSPNPLVGCVIVDPYGRFLSAGAHLEFGKEHAEVNACKGFESSAFQGAIAYVTLEPCAHTGKTPPCAELLGKLPLAKVVVGATDPNPKVNGQGLSMLRAAGIAVEQDESWAATVKKQNRVFWHHVTKGTVYWAMKTASSLDGTTAMEGDSRTWITNKRARAYGHFLRMIYDGIWIGWRTALIDNPALNVRYGWNRPRTPLRILADPQGRCAEAICKSSLHLTQSEPQRTLWLVSSDYHQKNKDVVMEASATGIHTSAIPYNDKEGFNKAALNDQLFDLNCYSVLIEGGAATYQLFLQQKNPQYLHLFQAPKVFFGSKRLLWNNVDKQLPPAELTDVELSQLDDNWLIEGQISWNELSL